MLCSNARQLGAFSEGEAESVRPAACVTSALKQVGYLKPLSPTSDQTGALIPHKPAAAHSFSTGDADCFWSARVSPTAGGGACSSGLVSVKRRVSSAAPAMAEVPGTSSETITETVPASTPPPPQQVGACVRACVRGCLRAAGAP